MSGRHRGKRPRAVGQHPGSVWNKDRTQALTSFGVSCPRGAAARGRLVNDRRREGSLEVAETQHVGMRIAPELVEAARRRVSDPEVSLSVLVRAALIKLADPELRIREALDRARTRPGPKPKADARA